MVGGRGPFDLDLVAVTTADADAVRYRKGWLLRTLVMWVVVPAFDP